MKAAYIGVCLAVVAFAPVASAQEMATCPHGQVGDWSWRADSMRFVIDNPTLQLNWETLGGDTTTSGLEIDVSALNGPDIVSSVYVRTAPPTFRFKPENAVADAKPNIFFGARVERGAPQPDVYPMTHDYVLFVTDEIEGEEKLLFSGRYEEWEPDDRKIIAGWLRPSPEGLGWRIVDVQKMRIVAGTRYYKGQAEGYDNVARTQLIDLGDMDPVWAAARAGHASERARAKATNLNCDWAK